MKVCVLGLWHLGTVTAACLASLGPKVIGLDTDAAIVASLRRGMAPVFEPDLESLIAQGLASGKLAFVSSVDDAVADVELLWVTYDSPIGLQDGADAESVLTRIEQALLAMPKVNLVLISSQLPVGSIHRLEQSLASQRSQPLSIAYSPENLRRGSAVRDFLHPERIIVGVRTTAQRERLQPLLGSITQAIEWMSVESAEMTKHAINAFLATSVVFANEIATLCESVGADAKQVERGLKTESRIGPRAYLSPGAAFAGGTLARDVAYLNRTAQERGLLTPLLSAVLPSNHAHKQWAARKLQTLLGDLPKATVAVWGLTFKAGTDSLERSLSVELCDWLIGQGASVHVHDPMAANLPERWRGAVQRFDDPLSAVRGAHALVMATEWPIYRDLSADQLAQCSDHLVVLDANRFLSKLAIAAAPLRYFAVGVPR
jgi:UDPglucose 6-dehydrogenase